MLGEECREQFPAEEGELFEFNRRLESFARNYKTVYFIDPYEALCDKWSCQVVQGSRLIYSDHAHLSVYGSQMVIAHFRDRFVSILQHSNQ